MVLLQAIIVSMAVSLLLVYDKQLLASTEYLLTCVCVPAMFLNNICEICTKYLSQRSQVVIKSFQLHVQQDSDKYMYTDEANI